MADHVEVMIAAVAIAILVMYFASEPVAAFIERHPTTKMLALSFLLLIGAALIADGFHFHIPRASLLLPALPTSAESVTLTGDALRAISGKTVYLNVPGSSCPSSIAQWPHEGGTMGTIAASFSGAMAPPTVASGGLRTTSFVENGRTGWMASPIATSSRAKAPRCVGTQRRHTGTARIGS
jgi:Integral membrane protein TerC family